MPTGNLKMRDVITSKDRKKLFEKLAVSISKGDTTKALLLIGKGAELDTPYYDRDPLSPSFSTDASYLNPNSRYEFTVFKATPILQAARKCNKIVCQFLAEAGANLSVQAKEYTFKREIINIDTHLELVAEPTLVSHHYHTRNSTGKDKQHVRQSFEYRPKLQERTIITTQDSRSTEKSYKLKPIDFSLVEA